MPVLSIEEFATALPRYAAVVGLDPGEKTLGIAVSDPTRTVASPLLTLARARFTDDANALFRLMDEREAQGIVIGLPVNMDGTEGARCQSNRALGRNLLRLRDLPITFWDERLSSAAVNRMLIDEHDMTRARRSQVVDKLAATYILQGALERMMGVPRDFLSVPEA